MTVSSQSGFSLIEVLVSLVVLAVGVLAVARCLATMNRMLAAGTVLTRVAVVGSNQMETLIARGCVAPSARGEAFVDGILLQWIAQSDPPTARAEVFVRFPLDFVDRVDSLRHFVVCRDES